MQRIYFIQQGKVGPIKIGVSHDPRKRLAQLQTGSSEKLYLLFEKEIETPTEEKEIHKKFRKYQLNGEWFQPANAIFEYITSLGGKEIVSQQQIRQYLWQMWRTLEAQEASLALICGNGVDLSFEDFIELIENPLNIHRFFEE